MSREYISVEKNSKELFSNRNEDGYIIIDIPYFTYKSREQVGNDNRIKNWIITEDNKKYLIKSDAKLNDEENYLEHAELICEEIANSIGIEYAKYDLAIINGQKGIICESILKEDEYMLSFEDFICGSMENPDPLNKGIIDYIDAFNQLKKRLKNNKYNKENAVKLLNDFNKYMVFDMIVGATDRHAENIGIILNEKDSSFIKLAPMYDSENSLLLENTKEMVQEMAFNANYLKQISTGIMPKLAVVPNQGAQVEDITNATFEFSYSQDEDGVVEDFAYDALETIDIDEIIKKVEDKIGSILPIEVKRVAKGCIEYRVKELSKVIYGDILVDYDEEYLKDIREKQKKMRVEQ